MGIVLAIVGLVVGLIVLLVVAGVVLWILGKNIPTEHQASSVIDLNVPPEVAYAAIEDIAAQPTWNKSTTSVEMLPDRNGLQTCRMTMGRNSFVMVRTRHEPPRVLERTITDDHGPFSGTWLYTVTPTARGGGAVGGGGEGSGCEVKLREVGRVSSPIPRAMMKYIFGYHMYLNGHLKALGKKFGQEVTPRKA